MRTIPAIGVSLLLLFGRVIAQPHAPSPLLSDADIARIITDRIDVQHQGVGIVVGVIDANGRRVIAHGSFGTVAGAAPVTGDTVFEIGSATKAFTSLLLADPVERGEVALTDPASKYLPADVVMPERGGRPITLQDLATHTSGLPPLPANLTPKDPGNPYATYSVPQLHAFLSSYQLPRDAGSKYEYSNLGAGHILASPSGGEIVLHNGGTGGYRSFIAFDPKQRTGIVVLSNMFTDKGVDDIGRHALDPSFPLNAPPVVRTEVVVNPDVVDRYVGKYELAPTFIMTITREGASLFLQATGQPKFELFASDQREFFLKAVDAQVTFDVGPDGRATRLILHQNGANQPAKRVDRG